MANRMYHYRVMRKLRGPCVAVVMVSAVTASAQPKPSAPPLVHAIEVVKIAPPAGFVDDAIGGDDTRVGYVLSDAASKCELHVASFAEPKQELSVDLSSITLHPIALPYLTHELAFVVGRNEDGRQVGALVRLTAQGKQ